LHRKKFDSFNNDINDTIPDVQLQQPKHELNNFEKGKVVGVSKNALG
jgi:hypothetical protein